jgi:hypothetical protein
MTPGWDPAFDPPHEEEAFDYEGYLRVLDALRRPVLTLAVAKIVPLPNWRWPPPQHYNGFTPDERIRGWQLNRWAETSGLMAGSDKACSVCRSIQKVGWHAENYYDLFTQIPLCQACHFMVHARFRQPLAWRRFNERYGRKCSKAWFEWLPRGPINLAGHLRLERGPQACDPLHQIPDELRNGF